MGNEASLEGGEGLAGLPPGASDGAPPQGPELAGLSAEERRQIAAVLSRAQETLPAETPPQQQPRHHQLESGPSPRQPGKPPDTGAPTLSKSRTVDTLKTEQRVPGRSPSSTSLRQSQSRTDFKEEQKSSMMPSFLSDANPFGAVTSVVNKFNPFDLISDSDATQEDASKKQKPVQKEPDKPGHEKGPAKQPAPQQSPKPAGPPQGAAAKPVPQKTGPPKQAQQQQSQPQPQGVAKQPQKPGSGQPKGPLSEDTKQPPGPLKAQPQQSEPAKPAPQQSPAKPSQQHPQGAAKPPSQPPDVAKSAPQTPSQKGGPPGKLPPQQPGEPAKAAPQAAGASKQPSPQPAGPAGSGRPPAQQAGGPAKAAIKPAGPAKQPQQKAEPTKPPEQHPGPGKPAQPQAAASPPVGSAPKKTFCPLCTTTELLLHTPEKANYNTCTQCRAVVCSLCGFNPNPHITEVKEWLCLNCQMQRALGGDLAPAPGPGPQPSPLKKAPAPATKPPSQPQQPTPKKDVPPKADVTQLPEQKKPAAPVKQPTAPGSPPVKAKPPVAETRPPPEPTPKPDQAKPALAEDKQKQPSVQKPTSDAVPAPSPSGPTQDSRDPKAQQKTGPPPRQEAAKLPQGAPPPASPDLKSTPQGSQQKADPKPVAQTGPRLDAKAEKPAEVKEEPKKTSPKPDPKQVPKGQQAPAGSKPTQALPQAQPQQPPKTPEQTRRLNLGGVTEAPKPQPTTPQESVTGKLFGFGASIFSQASNLISTSGQPGAQPQGPPPPGTPSKQPAPPTQAPAPQKDTIRQPQPSPKTTPVKKETKPPPAAKPEPAKAEGVKETGAEKKPLPATDTKPPAAETRPSGAPPQAAQSSPLTSACPLCKTELNVGSKDPPNYNTCTECKKVVCNLCGFNPMPHITEVQEWLCLNCQTQRALSGQLGDLDKVAPPVFSKPSPKPSPAKQPAPGMEKSKASPEIQKEEPKHQQVSKIAKAVSADKIQEDVQKEDLKAQLKKFTKTVSADKIIHSLTREGLEIQKATLAKLPSADHLPKDESKLTTKPSADKISEGIKKEEPKEPAKVLSSNKVQKEDPKLQQVKMAKTPSSAEHIKKQEQKMKLIKTSSAEHILKEDPKLQQVRLAKTPSADQLRKEDSKTSQARLAKTPSADQIQKEAPKTQEMKRARTLSSDKILQEVHQEDPKLLREKPSAGEVGEMDPKLPQAKLAKTPSADQIGKEESKQLEGKIVKTPYADQPPKDDAKLQQVKLAKSPMAEGGSDQAHVARTVEGESPFLPDTKHKPVIPEAKDQVTDVKREAKVHPETKVQEGVKKEDPAIRAPEIIPKDQKPAKEEISAPPAPLPKPNHVEAFKDRSEKEDDKSDASSSQQQKSPQGLSDTGYSSDGISSSLGEIPSLIPSDEKDMLKEPCKKEAFSEESSPTSPSDLAKLESTVLSILEAQASSLAEEKPGKIKDRYSIQAKVAHKTKPLPQTPEPYSSEEEDLTKPTTHGKDGGARLEGEKQSAPSRKGHKPKADTTEDSSARRQRYDSVDDSSESENSPVPRRKRRTSVDSSSSDEYKAEDSPGSGDDEDFIRKQLMEMSADEDASASEDDEFIRNQLKEISASESQKKEEVKVKKGVVGKHKKMTRKSSTGYDDDASRRHSWHDDDDEAFDESPEPKYRETKSQDSEEIAGGGGGGLRRFKTIELNSNIASSYPEGAEPPKRSLYFDEEPELEMESLTDSPEDRSRGEGSSSLHASSFTPGTSPTSVSSLDEDSDSSPSHRKMGDETKQQRKARHRTHGPLLPTIEDSSEEEELREEEELLKEQEKQRELEQQQRKSSSKKSKKDKDELRAQRRRERPKTPPSNLSPIEDASPTEELRQAAEMEELHRSSCSEYSPSIESDPEAFEISPEKIIEVQKVYKLPTAVSLYSPTEEKPVGLMIEESSQKTLKSAEEAFEEMLITSHKTKPFPEATEKDDVFEKEPLYGGMLIEDYIYESLVEDPYSGAHEANLMARQDESDEFGQSKDTEKKPKPDQIYGEPMQKPTDLQDYYRIETLRSILPQEDIVSSSYIMPESHEIVVLDSVAPPSSNEKPLLDADTAYEELMRRQRMQLTPGSSPTQPSPESISVSGSKTSISEEAIDSTSLVSSTTSAVSDVSSASPVVLPIPDVKITQHFTNEEIEDEYLTDYTREIEEIISHETAILTYTEALESAASVLPSDTSSLTSSTSSVYTTGSSSPDGTVSGYIETMDAISKLSDSEGTSSMTQVPIISTKEYSEPVMLPSQELPRATDVADLDQVVVSLPDMDSFGATSVEMLDRPCVSAAWETFPPEDVKARQAVSGSSVLEGLREGEQERAPFSLARRALTDGQKFGGAAPVVAPTPVISSVTSTLSSLPFTPSPVPTYTAQTRPFSRSSSLDSPARPPPPPPPPPLPPPLPPPILPKPAIYPKKKPLVTAVPTILPSATTSIKAADTTSAIKATKIYTPSPPPIPPKPASIPAGLVFTHRPAEMVKPPIAPKPAIPQLPTIVPKPAEISSKPIGLPLASSMTLNLVTPADYKLASPTSPLSPHSNKSSPRWTKSSLETYVVITLPSEPGTPTDSMTSQAITSWPLGSPPKELGPKAMPPLFVPSATALHIQGRSDPSKYVPGALQAISTVPVASRSIFEIVPNVAAQLMTTEVAKTTMSLVKSAGLGSVSITIPPETTHITEPPQYRENGRFHLFGDVIDLRTLTKIDIERMDSCMDLSSAPADVRRQMVVSDTSGRTMSTIQPAIINLSTAPTAEPPFAPVTEAITIVTCTATVSYSTSTESLVDLGHAMTTPLQLTTSKHFEPGPRVIGSQALPAGRDEVPINLSLGTPAQAATRTTMKPVTAPPVGVTNGWTDVSTAQEPLESGAVDLSTTKSHKTMVTVDETTSGIVTMVIEDNEKPVDLTAGRRAVCCDVLYKLPFGRSCTAQAPATTLPEDRFGYRDDHYQYDHSGTYGYKGIGGMKPSMSDTNLSEAGLFQYKSKNTFDYQVGATDVAVDLTASRITTGEIMDYSSKISGPYPETRQVISGIGISAPQYSQARIVPSSGPPYGIGSVLRSSNGVVYSSVATPVPSTFAITTQPGSIFSTSARDLSSIQPVDTIPSLSTMQSSQALPRSYNFLTTAASENDGAITGVDIDSGLPPLSIETLTTEPANLIPVFTTASEAFIDIIEDEETLLIAPDEGQQQHLDLERELLELEKRKQQRFAEELEWERQEIQRFREQEQMMVQQKLEELQSMKHHLLYQQEEERQAQFMMRQETLAQQQLHIEQIQQLQQQLHQHLEEQKIQQIYQYNYDPNGTVSPQTTTEQAILEGQYGAANGQFWTADEVTTTSSAVLGIEIPQSQAWYSVQSDGVTQYIPRLGMLGSVSEMSLKDMDVREEKQLKKRSSLPKLRGPYEEFDDAMEEEPRCLKKIVESGVQTDDEDGADVGYQDRRRRTKKGVDTSVQTDDEDQDEWDPNSRSRRKARAGKYEGSTEVDKAKAFSKVSSVAVQTVAEISVQTEPMGTIRTPSVRAQLDAKIEIIKHISAPEKTYKGGSLGCQTETDSETQNSQYLTATSPPKDKKRPTPLEIGYSSHLCPEPTLQVAPSPPKSPKVLYSPISPISPAAVIESAFVPYEKPVPEDISPQKILHADVTKLPQLSPKSAKVMQRSLSDPKPLSPTAEDASRAHFQYTDGYLTQGSSSLASSGMQKKVKRTLPNPPPEDVGVGTQSAFTTVGSVSRRRICRSTTMARAKILQDIDRELDLVERESAKLRKKQAELDEEEKEIDAKLRYLEMGINRRKEALLKEREKRERAYLQGVAEERDYMSDSEVSSTRPTRIEAQHGLERPRTAPQTEFESFIPPQTQPEAQFATPTSPYTQYQYSSPALPTQAPTQYTQQSHYQQQQPLYQQQVSPYQTQSAFQSVDTMSFTAQAQPPPSQQPSYQLSSQLMVIPQKTRQTSLYLEPKITTNYDVIRNQPLMIAPASSDNTYAVSHLGSKYSTLDLRMGLDERSSIASSPISSISGDSFYADIDHHTSRNYVLLDDLGELSKGTSSLSSVYGLHEKDLTKTDRLLRTTEARRVQEVSDFLAPLQTSSRLHGYLKTDEDPMEDPYELKLLKHQIKQEFRRGTDALDHLAGLSQYYPADTSYRHFPKSEKYSISRLTLEKQAAKQLPAAILYQKQSKHKKALLDPKLSKFSPIQESRDLELDYSSYLTSNTSTLGGITSRARLLQDDITYGLRKNITDQQKYMAPTLTHTLGTSLGAALSASMRSTFQDDVDKPYSSGSRSRPSSRPSSVYGLDLSLKRDSSSSSLRLKAQEAEPLDVSFSHAAPSGRVKPTSLPISQSRGRIPIVAQNSEEESPLSPVGQPMGMARAAAGPLPPISADTRDQFGSSHSLPEVQQHMREESRARNYGRDIAYIMDDFQHAMSDSEAYHLRREETDWFDKPREPRLENGHAFDRRLPDKLAHSRPPSQHQDQKDGDSQLLLKQSRKMETGSQITTDEDLSEDHRGNGTTVGKNRRAWNKEGWFNLKCQELKMCIGGTYGSYREENSQGIRALPFREQMQINGKPIHYIFPHARLKLLRDPKDRSVSGNGLGIRIVGGKEISGTNGEIGAYVAKILPGGSAEQTGKLVEGMQVLEWNGIPLTGKTYEEVQSIIGQQSGEAEICVRLDLSMLSDGEAAQHLELLDPGKSVDKTKSPGVDPKQLAAELQKVSLQQTPLAASSALEKGSHTHSGTTSATSSSVPSPGQPGSPSVSKKRHSSGKPTEAVKSGSHPITGEIQLQTNYDKHLGNLIIHVLQARNLAPRDNNGYSDPFVKVYLLPGRGQVMVVQNASVENKRRTKYVQKSLNPEWNQTVIYKNISMEQIKKKTLEVTVWDYDRYSANDFLGEVLIDLSSASQLDNAPRWYPLKEQSDSIDHGKSHSGQGNQQTPKPSVIKSRSHGIFPDPSKDMQVPTIEKSHSSPGSSKSSSEGHLRSHGPSRSQSKTSVTQTHLEDAGAAIAAAEAAVQQLRLQPTAHKSGQSNHARKQHRHSIAGVLPIQRTQSDNLPPPASDSKDQGQLALRKVMSDGPVKPEGARPTNHRPGESSVSTGSSASSFGNGYGVDSEGSSSATTGDSNLFPIPRIGKMSQNGHEPGKQAGVGLTDTEGKTQVMGEIKIALKKEMKTDGEQLIVEILQCRNITYKFKSPDHLPDLYVKLYVVNLATQKRVIKKKTRVCRHDREPSFNETFRLSLSPTGHSLQIILVSNGGKFMKKTLIGEAYIWLDKVDLRKRIVNWHKLLVSSTQTH